MLFVCFSINLSAKRIDYNEAYRKAKQFRSGNVIMSRSNSDAGKTGYYVFNYDAGGFVIVSGSDRTAEILGYSTIGTFKSDDLPENLASFLKSYSDQIEFAEKHNISYTNKSRSSDSWASIEPLVKSKWEQRTPYNDYCPTQNGSKTLTGCGATALAQVMAYHKSNYKSVESISYKSGGNIYTINLDTCQIDYDNLCIEYKGDENLSQKHAIAKLMKVCGYSIETVYGVNASYASIYYIANTLKNYFNFDCNLTHNREEWDVIIYDGLKDYGPVMLSGYSPKSGGHTWVCDGYKDGYFHMNWGWSGQYDGYFRLPEFYVGGYDFTQNIHALIVKPKEENTNKASGKLMLQCELAVNSNSLSVMLTNPYIYDGDISSYGYLIVDEHNDSIFKSESNFKLLSGDSVNKTINLDIVNSWNLENGVNTLIPTMKIDDNMVALIDKEVYVGITPYNKSLISDDRETVLKFIETVYKENFKVKKLDSRSIKIDIVDKHHPVRVFDFGGNMIYSGNESEIKLPKAGLYIIKNGKANTSFIIK